ncbi:MAG: AAA family ATPase [Planctomycetes bacterium]|nr:AAA family ATPase [Planctomycetota bacterium]
MYEKYWALDDKPFRNTPDPHYLFFSKQHEEAITRILYAITEGQGAVMLTGDYGCGKTLITRVLLDELDPDRFEVAYIPYSNLTAKEFLQEILRQFGYETKGLEKVELLQVLSECLLDNHSRGCSTIVVVDEAQMILDHMTMEEIRLLLNFQQNRKFFLTLVLVGQPELRDRVEEMPQLLQRLSIRYHIGPLSEEDSFRYMSHRLKVAGGKHEILTRDAERLIASVGEGVPRKMNNIADMSLLVGFGQKAPLVDEEIVRQVAVDMND